MRVATASVLACVFAVCVAGCKGKDPDTSAPKESANSNVVVNTAPPGAIASQVPAHEQIHGPQGGSSTLNIVILGDGFTSAQMHEYRGAVHRYVDDLLGTAPFDTMKDAIAIYRVDVVSADGGIQVPANCDGKDVTTIQYPRRHVASTHNNALKVQWCADGKTLRYPQSTDETLVREFALASGVFPNLTIVLLNDWMFGAAAYQDGALGMPGADPTQASGGLAYISIEMNLTGDTT